MVNDAAVNVSAQEFVRMSVSDSFEYRPRNGTAGSRGTVALILFCLFEYKAVL